MPSRRRTQPGLVEPAIQVIGVALMMIVMFYFLPGGDGIRAAAILENLDLTDLGGIALLFAGFAASALLIRSLRPRTPIERGNSTIFHNHVSKPASALTLDVASQLRNIDWLQFGKLVALTYRKLGYNVEQPDAANADGDFDLIIKKVGQRTAVQCKHWKNSNVGVNSIREFLSALKHSGIEKGIFVTLNGYTAEAKRLADKHGIEIISESKLNLMLESTDVHFDPEAKLLLSEQEPTIARRSFYTSRI